MKILITMFLVFTMSILVACNDKNESEHTSNTENSAKQISNIASIAPSLTPSMAATRATASPVMSNDINEKPELVADAGPLKPLLTKACACKTPECGSQVLDELLLTVKSNSDVKHLGQTISTLSSCIMETGIDKNEFIAKMRQLRR